MDLMYTASISESFDSMSYVTYIFDAQGEVLVLLKWMESFHYVQWDQNYGCIWSFQEFLNWLGARASITCGPSLQPPISKHKFKK